MGNRNSGYLGWLLASLSTPDDGNCHPTPTEPLIYRRGGQWFKSSTAQIIA